MNDLHIPLGRDKNQPKGINAVETGYRVLMAVQLGPGSVSLSDIAARTGLSAGAVHNYLTSLVRTGLVEREERGRYRLGPSAFALSCASFRLLNGYDTIRNEARALHELTEQSVGVSVWSQGGPISIYILRASNLAGSFTFRPGLLPLLGSGSGLLYLAYLPESDTGELIEHELATASDPRPRADVIAAARELVIPAGYARFVYGSPEPFSLNVPVWTNEDEIPFMLSVVVHQPVDQATLASWINAMKASADRASHLLARTDATGPRAVVGRLE